MKLILILAFLSVVAGLPRRTPVIHIRSGKLRGIVFEDGFRGSFNCYMGIPYARAERFQEPKSVQWEGIFDAREDSIHCSQRDWVSTFTNVPSVAGQEDCLTLNLYTPSSDASKSANLNLKPVMVFIHGGGFRDGTSQFSLYGPQYLIRHNVIIVVINFRLDVFGFLCLGIKEAPGNLGLKDQVKALEWIKENIREFGGDPDNVTVFGESSGSAAVMYHLISPMSKGLFHKVIMQSGSAISSWAFQFEPIKTASLLAKQMGYDTDDPYEIYNIFKNATEDQLLSTRVPRKKGAVVQEENIFVPCAEKQIPEVQPFITDNPYNLIFSGQYVKVPTIIGFNDQEGYLFAAKENKTMMANLNFYDSLPRDLKFSSDEDARATAAKLQELYNMNGRNFSKETLFELADYEGDLGVIYPVVSTTDLLIKTNDKPVYVYKFSYGGLLNLGKIVPEFENAHGAAHCDELMYLFEDTLSGLFSIFESDMINKMTTMWTNFAQFSDPTPGYSSFLKKWKPTEPENCTIFVIDREDTTAPLWDSDRLLFWNQTYLKYRRKE